MARIDCRVEVELVVGMRNSAGRRLAWDRGSRRRSSKEDLRRTDLVDRNCFERDCTAQQLDQRMMCLVGRSYPVVACDGRGDRDDDRDVRLEGREMTDSAVDRKYCVKLESAVHMVVRRSRTGYPDHIVKSHRNFEHYRYSSVQMVPVPPAYAVH